MGTFVPPEAGFGSECPARSVEVATEAEVTRSFDQAGTGAWVSHAVDEQLSLGMLGPTEELRAADIADDGGMLERCHGIGQERHHVGRVGLGVPRTEGDDSVAPGGVEGARDEVGLSPET